MAFNMLTAKKQVPKEVIYPEQSLSHPATKPADLGCIKAALWIVLTQSILFNPVRAEIAGFMPVSTAAASSPWTEGFRSKYIFEKKKNVETYITVTCFQMHVRSPFCTTSGQPQRCTQVLVMKAQIWKSRRCLHRVYKPQHCPTLKPNALTASSMRHPSAQEKKGVCDLSKLPVFPQTGDFQVTQTDDPKGKLTHARTVQHGRNAYLLCECCLSCWGSLSAYASSVN